MKTSCTALLAASLLALPLLGEAQLAQLTVTVRGLEPASGKVEVSVFNTPGSFLQKPLVQKTQPADGLPSKRPVSPSEWRTSPSTSAWTRNF